MNLLINGIAVKLNRLPLEGGSYILQVLITINDFDIHRSLVTALTHNGRGQGGVMDMDFNPSENRLHESEIRVLEGLELEVVDLARLVGYGVMQQN
jgi:hypothetical protein